METAASRPALEPATLLLGLLDSEAVQWEMQQLQLAIAQRAYELFQLRGGKHGHDWEDWFRAESEFLRPVSIAVSETSDRVSVRANVMGFGQHELKISVEPRRAIILGQRDALTGQAKLDHRDATHYRGRIRRVIDLPAEVLPEAAVVELEEGLLKFNLPKAIQT